MIRFFVLTGLVGGTLTAWLATAGVGPVAQLPPPETLLTGFREEGYLPQNPSLEEDHEAEDMGIFEIPPEDEFELAKAEAAFEEMMSDMGMEGMNMSGADGAMAMGGSEAGGMEMAEGTAAGETMEMGASEAGNMQMAEGETAGEAMNMGGSEAGGMQMGEGMAMSPSNAALMGEGGLLITKEGAFDREIVLGMNEWSFSEMEIAVKAGETIKFTVTNDGEIPHEFMFMSPPLMQAANYRVTRADWSLLEHEALFEQALVLPGGEFSFVLKVTEPGSWMFMCMLPYHMQMGMMGQMATEGMAMEM